MNENFDDLIINNENGDDSTLDPKVFLKKLLQKVGQDPSLIVEMGFLNSMMKVVKEFNLSWPAESRVFVGLINGLIIGRACNADDPMNFDKVNIEQVEAALSDFVYDLLKNIASPKLGKPEIASVVLDNVTQKRFEENLF